MKNKKLRLYEFYDSKQTEYIVVVVAENIREAKKIAIYEDETFINSEYIDIKGRWLKNFNAEELKLNKGLLSDQMSLFQGVKLGIYGWIIVYCHKCNKELHFTEDNCDDFICPECGHDLSTCDLLR